MARCASITEGGGPWIVQPEDDVLSIDERVGNAEPFGDRQHVVVICLSPIDCPLFRQRRAPINDDVAPTVHDITQSLARLNNSQSICANETTPGDKAALTFLGIVEPAFPEA